MAITFCGKTRLLNLNLNLYICLSKHYDVFQKDKGCWEPPIYYTVSLGRGAVVRVVRVERPDLVWSVQLVHANSLSQDMLCFLLEAVQVVALPQVLQPGGGGTCGGQTSFGW